MTLAVLNLEKLSWYSAALCSLNVHIDIPDIIKKARWSRWWEAARDIYMTVLFLEDGQYTTKLSNNVLFIILICIPWKNKTLKNKRTQVQLRDKAGKTDCNFPNIRQGWNWFCGCWGTHEGGNTVSWRQSFWHALADMSTRHSFFLILPESISWMSGFFLNWLVFLVID